MATGENMKGSSVNTSRGIVCYYVYVFSIINSMYSDYIDNLLTDSDVLILKPF
jgi:hypothetical protein